MKVPFGFLITSTFVIRFVHLLYSKKQFFLVMHLLQYVCGEKTQEFWVLALVDLARSSCWYPTAGIDCNCGLIVKEHLEGDLP